MSDSRTSSQTSPPAPSPWGPYAAAIAILLAGVVVYANSFHGPFIFDDIPTVVQNESIRRLRPLTTPLSPPAASTTAGRPLVNLSLAVNYAIGGLDVVGYHVLNLVVHLLAALTLFGVVRRTLVLCGATWSAKSTPLAAAVALIWTVHPLETESVTYITQRAESIVSLFYLLTLYAAIRSMESDRPLAWRTISVVACLAGMASKEVMVSAPLVVLIYDRIFVAQSFGEIRRRRGWFYLALAATWGLLAWLVFEAGNRSRSAGFGLDVGVGEYAATQLVAIPHYLRLCFWPHPLVLDYGAGVVTAPSQVVPGALVTGLLVAATLAALRFWPRAGFLGLWFFALLAPSSSFVPVATQTMAEHRVYLALAAAATAFVLAANWLLEKLRGRFFAPGAGAPPALAAGAAGLVIAALGLQTLVRNRDYESALAIWQDAVRKRPDVGRVHAALAAAYLQTGEGGANMAIREATKAIELDPEPGAYINRGHAYLIRGRSALALADFNRAIELEPEFGPSYFNRGSALVQLGRLNEALADFDRAVELAPAFGAAYQQRGVVNYMLARYDDALNDFDRTIELEPRAGDAYYNRAQTFYALKNYDRALRDALLSRELGFQGDLEFFQKLHEAAGKKP